VRRLRDEGMTIAFTGGDRRRGESIASETGGSFFACDHRDRASSDHAVEQALAIIGSCLDVLVTNADTRFEGSIENTPQAVFAELLEANLTSVFRVARACFAPMRASGGGSMIHIASDAGIRAAHEAAAYSVTSAGVIAAAELLAAEGAPHGIRCNAVCPGGIRGDKPPSGRLGTGTDVASLVAWLAGDESAHMTGATLRVDGGVGAAMVVDTRI
jgi:NAD(P)-dependent dehydrogenase (short-subunit alcohol dehydrogenase family)